MDADTFCRKHNLTPASNEWKVVMDELVSPDNSKGEPFYGQVCPVCYLRLRETLTDAKRRLKIESRSAIELRSEADQLQEVVNGVLAVVKEMTGIDVNELVHKKYRAHSDPSGVALLERGELKRILPNVIAEAIRKGKHDVEDSK